MFTRKYRSVTILILLIALIAFPMAVSAAPAAPAKDVTVIVYQPESVEDETCAAYNEIVASGAITDTDTLDLLNGLLADECTNATAITWDVPAGQFTYVPADHTAQGDLQVVISGTQVISGGVVSTADMVAVYHDSRQETGEVTVFEQPSWVYCPWGCDVFSPEAKTLMESHLEMAATGCGLAEGCVLVYKNITGVDTTTGETFVRRMSRTELAAQFLADLAKGLRGG